MADVVSLVTSATADWRDACQRTDRGVIIPNLANVMAALRGDPAVNKCIARDDMFCGAMLMAPIPRSKVVEPEPFKVRPITDDDAAALQEWLQHAGPMPHIGK